MKTLLLLLLLGVFTLAVEVQAATYWVNSASADANQHCFDSATEPSTANQSRTVAQGLACMKNAGDKLYLQGTFTNQKFLFTSHPAGTSDSNRTVIANAPGKTARFNITTCNASDQISINSWTTLGESPGTVQPTSNPMIFDWSASNPSGTLNCGNGITLGTGARAVNVEIFGVNGQDCNSQSGSGASGIYMNGTGAEVINSHIHDNGKNPGGCAGRSDVDFVGYNIYAHATNGVIRGNRIHHAGGYGIQTYSEQTAAPDQIVTQNLIYNNGVQGTPRAEGLVLSSNHAIASYNAVYDNIGAGIALGGACGGTGCVIYGNTVDGNGFNGGLPDFNTQGLVVTGSTAIVRNNIVTNNSGGVFTDQGAGSNPTFDHNLCFGNGGSGNSYCNHTGDVIANPLFVDLANKNFQLSSGSPAINAGTPNIALGIVIPACSGSIVLNCYNGTAPELGAFETGLPVAGGGPPTLVTNLTSVAAGQEIKVTIDDDDVNERTESTGDYVGLYAPGVASTAYIDWFYMNNTKTAPTTAISDAVLTFTAPSTPGTYEFRFYQNGSTLEADRLATATFTCISAGIVMKFSVSSLKIGPSVTWKVGTP